MMISGGAGGVSRAYGRAAVTVAGNGVTDENDDGAMDVDDGKEARSESEADTNVSSNNVSSTGRCCAEDNKSSSGGAAEVEAVPSAETGTGAGVGAGAPAVGQSVGHKNIVGSVGIAKLRKIWDPAVPRVEELFSAATTATAAAASTVCERNATSGGGSITGESGDGSISSSSERNSGSDSISRAGSSVRGGKGTVDTDAVRKEALVSSSSSPPLPSTSCVGVTAVSSVSGGTSGGSSANRAVNRAAIQAGRVAWCDDGETFFLLNHEGNLLKIKTHCDGSLSLLARADPQGGASPATLQLAPDGDKVLIATATRGLCLVPTEDLDLVKAEPFGENLGPRGAKARYWGAATLGDIHGRGHDGSRKRRLTIVGNPSRTRDDKTDLFFFGLGGGQPERIDTPRREGVLALACSPRRPLLMFLCPTGEVYFKEEVLKTDFPGPWYPSGYVLIDNNVDYLEAEDELDTVVMTGPGGEVLSKTQAHEVVVPWQHEAVAQEDSSLGEKEEPVDVEGGGDTELWADAQPGELRWVPEREDSWPSEGGSEDGSGGPRSSPRGGGQESFAGPLARLLGATPALLKEARKRFGSSGMSENDLAEKRRKLVPKMMEDLAIKKKKNDEEAIKRKRKLEEARAKARRNRERKAAAEAEKAAERAKEAEIRAAAARAAAEEEAARNEESDQRRTDTAEAAENDRHPMVGVQALLTTSGNMKGRGAAGGGAMGGTRDSYDGGVRGNKGSTAAAAAVPLVTSTGADAAVHTLMPPPDDCPPSTDRSNGCGGGSVGGAAADAAAWLAANAPGDEADRQMASSTLVPATSSWGSRGLVPEGARATASAGVISGELMPVPPAVLGSASGSVVGAGWRRYAEERDGSARSESRGGGAGRDYQQRQDSSSVGGSRSLYLGAEDRVISELPHKSQRVAVDHGHFQRPPR
ncbi:hypothetical protein Esi_0242_0022 [Ectocarpus siliculosus]|uniref:Uncharacterized protein n=1 Tax=Ectocarpus siliculosus TaxID=2880 RepID=D7FSY9_ECTSI|nr:hypothetical protein Esi_0242_0022 [Ectocarpus siliculosus]|eukprot:CBJ31280.1 hypothetical protein Esi_0242_0022 [Ectocarpus siliculosus]